MRFRVTRNSLGQGQKLYDYFEAWSSFKEDVKFFFDSVDLVKSELAGLYGRLMLSEGKLRLF